MNEQNKNIPTKEQVEALINSALDMLYTKDSYLIDNSPYHNETDGIHHVGERSIVFRLAHYMQNIMDEYSCFENYVLDCEYNRNGTDREMLPSFTNGICPDVIIHNRGNNDNNLLIMEVKTYWNSDNKRDKVRIREFLDESGEYRFSFGISLVIKRNREDVRVNLKTVRNYVR